MTLPNPRKYSKYGVRGRETWPYAKTCSPCTRTTTYHSTTIHCNMDFAPYQDTAPESVRALSPPPQNRPTSPPIRNNARSPPPVRPNTDPFAASSLPAPNHFSNEPRGFGGGDGEGGRLDVNLFETSLPLRLDYEACLAYLALPPAGGVFLLVTEHKSDYVRYVLQATWVHCPNEVGGCHIALVHLW